MKSAEEYIPALSGAVAQDRYSLDGEVYDSTHRLILIKQIQLDAYKAGMSEAAEIASEKAIRFDGIMPLDGFETKKVIVHTILSARDKKETI